MGNKLRRLKLGTESNCYSSSSEHSTCSNDKEHYDAPLIAVKNEIKCDETLSTKFTDIGSPTSESNYDEGSGSVTNTVLHPQPNPSDIGCPSPEFNTPSPEYIRPVFAHSDFDICRQEFVAVSVSSAEPAHLLGPSLASRHIDQSGERSTYIVNGDDYKAVSSRDLGLTQINSYISEFMYLENSTCSSGESSENFCMSECILIKIPSLICSPSELTIDNDDTLNPGSRFINMPCLEPTTVDRLGPESTHIGHPSPPQGYDYTRQCCVR